MNEPLQITADEITPEDCAHLAQYGYIKRPGQRACHMAEGLGDELRKAICELAADGIKWRARPRLMLKLDGTIVEK